MDEIQWWPSKRDYDPKITKETWIKLLDDRSIFYESNLYIFACFYDYGGVATCTELANKYGGTANTYLNSAVSLAKRIVNARNCGKIDLGDERSRFWPVLFVGHQAEKENEGVYVWKIRDELMDALKEYGIEKWLEENNLNMDGVNKIDDYVNLLKLNHNIILHGAPGTGKTYLAKEIAKAMCEKGDGSDVEIGFVQFHPSYDYTDFVEGLRPKNRDDGQIGFERMDGVFKEFCKMAIKSSENAELKVDNFDEAWKNLVNYLDENDNMDVSLLSGKGTFPIELNEYGTGLATRTYTDETRGDWISGKSKFFSKDQLYNIYKGLPGVPMGGHDNYRKAIVKVMKDNFGLKDYIAPQLSTATPQLSTPYVFIIDEINRGEISKIFGELFFSIDPGYRGEKGLVQTQYQNLVEEGDIFKKGFFIPENVYIIGTMNDIDRSVESMDFAMRRRFVFKEITAAESAENMNLGDEAKHRMTALNDTISRIDGLGSSYHIGAAYFLKDGISISTEKEFTELWDLRLESLLTEYLRGTGNESKLKDLKTAYESGKSNSDDSGVMNEKKEK